MRKRFVSRRLLRPPSPYQRNTSTKYRYVITNEGIVEAATPAEAEAAAFEQLEIGVGIFVCDIEPLPGEAREP